MALKQVVFGSALITPANYAVGTALMKGEVPAAWEKKWEGPENVSKWLSVLVVKKNALNEWLARSSRGALLDDPLTLSDLFHPGTFLNGTELVGFG